MTKNILIAGPKGSGKKNIAFHIAKEYDESEVVRINYKVYSHLINDNFIDCFHKGTKLVIFTKCNKIDDVKELLSMRSIKTEKKYEKPIIIKPKIVVIFKTSKDYNFEPHWHNRYNIIKSYNQS